VTPAASQCVWAHQFTHECLRIQSGGQHIGLVAATMGWGEHLTWSAHRCIKGLCKYWADQREKEHMVINSNSNPVETLGAEGVLPGRYIESLLRVFKQFTHTLPCG